MTGPAGGTSPRPSESSGAVDLFGTSTTGRSLRRRWAVELTGISPVDGLPATHVRVTLVDCETGKRSAIRVPFSELQPIATGGTAYVQVEEGTYT
jgi:hypothetical protein